MLALLAIDSRRVAQTAQPPNGAWRYVNACSIEQLFICSYDQAFAGVQ
jgi:hypothetical protein